MNTVAILGASSHDWRYANKAQVLLTEKGYRVLPVSRDGHEVLGVAGFASLGAIAEPVDTVTVYVRPGIFDSLADDVLDLAPRRVIFNPGSESPASMKRLRDAGIRVVEACTLVLLRTGQFEVA